MKGIPEGIDHSHVTDVEHDVIVRFADVVTLPVCSQGRIVVIYVGITGLQKLALQGMTTPATEDDVVDIARRLTLPVPAPTLPPEDVPRHTSRELDAALRQQREHLKISRVLARLPGTDDLVTLQIERIYLSGEGFDVIVVGQK